MVLEPMVEAVVNPDSALWKVGFSDGALRDGPCLSGKKAS